MGRAKPGPPFLSLESIQKEFVNHKIVNERIVLRWYNDYVCLKIEIQKDKVLVIMFGLLNEIKDKKWYKHLSTINEHKLLVGKNCFRCGLYLQGILHDLSKYSWTEFSVGAKYYQGTRSPNEAEREDKGYTSSWLHHKGRNKHHLEYWLDYDLDKRDGSVTGMKMPDNYIVEMFCDRVAASKVYRGKDYTDRSALEYYMNGKSKNILHPYTKKQLERLLNILAEEGEDVAFDYARRYVKGYRKYLKRKKYKKRLEKRLEKKYSNKLEKKLSRKYNRRLKHDIRRTH